LRTDAWKVGKSVEKLVDELGFGGRKLGRDYGVGEGELRGLAKAAVASLEGWEGMPGEGEVLEGVLERIW